MYLFKDIMRTVRIFSQLLPAKSREGVHHPPGVSRLSIIELYVLNKLDSAHDFAMEMQKQMEAYFVFLLKPSRKEFLHILLCLCQQ